MFSERVASPSNNKLDYAIVKYCMMPFGTTQCKIKESITILNNYTCLLEILNCFIFFFFKINSPMKQKLACRRFGNYRIFKFKTLNLLLLKTVTLLPTLKQGRGFYIYIIST